MKNSKENNKSILCYLKEWHGFHDECYKGKSGKNTQYPYPFLNYNSHWIRAQKTLATNKDNPVSILYYLNRFFLQLINSLIIIAAVYFAFTRNNMGNPLPNLTVFSIITPIFAFFFPIIYIIWYMISGLYYSLSKN